MAMEKHFIQEGVIRSEIESYLRDELNRTGYSGVDIQKTPLATRIVLYVEKPPLVIGKKGKRINRLTTVLKEKYGLENPTIDVQAVEKPTLDPNIVVRRIAVALERGMNRRRVAYKAVRAIMGSGAIGVEIILSGKIVGKGGRSRVEKYFEGHMKKAGDSLRLVRIGSTQAFLKAGVIGVTAKIVPPNTVFPDQIQVWVREKVVGEKPGVVDEGPKLEESKLGEPKLEESKLEESKLEELRLEKPKRAKKTDKPKEKKKVDVSTKEKNKPKEPKTPKTKKTRNETKNKAK